MENPLISVVSPEYKGEKMVHNLVTRIIKSVSTITDNFEIILVNDASPDNTWAAILQESQHDKRVKGLNLSRNFGQHNAITAGVSYASGEWVVIMDCDLQDRPEEIPKLYAKALEGWDIVQGQRIVRHDKFLKRMSSKCFHAVLDYLGDVKTDASVANFGIYKKIVMDQYVNIPEKTRGLATLIRYLGFKDTRIPIEHDKRGEGKSSYTLRKLFTHAFNILISNTNKPLRLMVQFGFFFSLVSMILVIYNIVAKLTGIIQVPGYTSTVFSIWFVGGLIMMQLGVVGIYIGRIFDQVKGRPIFVVMDKINF
jgi:dolichol-phosphate mannosyltransferase